MSWTIRDDAVGNQQEGDNKNNYLPHSLSFSNNTNKQPDEAVLYGWAHCVFENDEGCCVFLGSQQAQRYVVSSLFKDENNKNKKGESKNKNKIPITGIVNCTNNFPNIYEQEQQHDHDDGDELSSSFSNVNVNKKKNEKKKHQSIEYCRVAVNDENGANILVYLDGATEFIHRHLNGCTTATINNNNQNNSDGGRGGSVLVHCQMGISRSSTIVIAYLMRYYLYTRDGAYSYIKQKREQVCPNLGFWHQLQVFESRLRKTKQNNDNENKRDSSSMNYIFDVDSCNDWAEQSIAKFHTIGHLLLKDDNNDDGYNKELEECCFPEISNIFTTGGAATTNTENTEKTQSDTDGAITIGVENKIAWIIEKILFVALDFIFGRGVKDCDLPWLHTLCLILSQQLKFLPPPNYKEFRKHYHTNYCKKNSSNIIDCFSMDNHNCRHRDKQQGDIENDVNEKEEIKKKELSVTNKSDNDDDSCCCCSKSSRHIRTNNIDPIIIDILFSSFEHGSEFSEVWSGEIYPNHIEKIKKLIVNTL